MPEIHTRVVCGTAVRVGVISPNMDSKVFERMRSTFGLHHLEDLQHEGSRTVEVIVNNHDAEHYAFLAAAIAQPLFTALQTVRIVLEGAFRCALGERTLVGEDGAFEYEVLVAEWLKEEEKKERSVATIRIHPRGAEVALVSSGASFRLTGVAVTDLSYTCNRIKSWDAFEEMLAMLLTSYFEFDAIATLDKTVD